MRLSLLSPSFAASRLHFGPLMLLLLAAVPAWAWGPNFSKGGITFGIQYGQMLWKLDTSHLASQVGPDEAKAFTQNVQDTHAIGLRLGYNILGHASVEAAVTATGWNLATQAAGGAGFGVGLVRWHPMELVFALLKRDRPIPLDASTYFGLGYGIAGQERGMDGLILQWGADVDFFPLRFLGAGLFARGIFPQWKSFYLDYYNRAQPGATLPLPAGSGGALWQLGAQLLFRFGE